MKVFEPAQEIELKKTIEYITSKDKEIVKMGIEYLRKSEIYKGLRTRSLFYYPDSTAKLAKVRVSSLITGCIKCILSDKYPEYIRNRAAEKVSTMVKLLISKDAQKYFRREFINTAKFF